MVRQRWMNGFINENDIIKELGQDVAVIRPDVLFPSEIVTKAEAIGHKKAYTSFFGWRY